MLYGIGFLIAPFFINRDFMQLKTFKAGFREREVSDKKTAEQSRGDMVGRLQRLNMPTKHALCRIRSL